MKIDACRGAQVSNFSSERAFDVSPVGSSLSAFDHFIQKHRELAVVATFGPQARALETKAAAVANAARAAKVMAAARAGARSGARRAARTRAMATVKAGAKAAAAAKAASAARAAAQTKAPLATLRSLVLLGSVSAVESYCREVLHRLIVVDEHSQSSVLAKPLPYGAAVIGSGRAPLLSDALLEGTTFSGGNKLGPELASFTGLKTVAQKVGQLQATADFDTICQLRHCVAHRYGHLGVSNATSLGFDTHGPLASRRMNLSQAHVQEVLQISVNIVVELNNLLYNEVLLRAHKNGPFTWDKRRDMKRFSPLAKVFLSEVRPHFVSDLGRAYDEFRGKLRTQKPTKARHGR